MGVRHVRSGDALDDTRRLAMRAVRHVATCASSSLQLGVLVVPSALHGALPQLPVGGAADAYTLVWQDEFEGNALDSASWTATRGSHGSERQYYLPDNVAVSNGTLRLTTRHEPRLVQHLNPNSQQG